MMINRNSNNSVIIYENDENVDYKSIANLITTNGEPGIFFIDNARKYSRMNGQVDNKDIEASGKNPCGEYLITIHSYFLLCYTLICLFMMFDCVYVHINRQILCNYEICNLVENFISKATDFEDFKRTLKFAFLYAKSVTLLPVHWEKTRKIIDKNRRIGTSISGITDFIAKMNAQGINGKEELKSWMNRGYEYLQKLDTKFSEWLNIPESIKITSIKPSGTLGLVAGTSPGIHYHTSQFYIRRVRMSNTDPLLKLLSNAGYLVEPCFGDEVATSCVEIPVDCGEQYGLDNLKCIQDVSIWDQFDLVALAQKHWSDNSVSATITFKSNETEEIIKVIKAAKIQLKGASFLPHFDTTNCPYKQMPYEPISKEIFLQRNKQLKPIDYNTLNSSNIIQSDAETEKYCNTDVCMRK